MKQDRHNAKHNKNYIQGDANIPQPWQYCLRCLPLTINGNISLMSFFNLKEFGPTKYSMGNDPNHNLSNLACFFLSSCALSHIKTRSSCLKILT